MEELKKARAVRKGILTKSCNKTDRIIYERSLTAITDHREHLIKTFQLFEDSAEDYTKLLTSDSEIATADDYYNDEMKLYVEQLGKLNSAMDTLHIKQQPVREDVSTIAAMSHVLNMPKLELESFDGTPAQYHKFMSIFTQVIEPVTPDPTLRLTRLLCHTTGEAHQAISGVDLGDAECYTRAMAILKENFGSKYVVGASIMRNLKHGPIATTPKDIRNLATELQNAETCLKRHNMYGELNNQECIVAVCGRLTKDMKSKWASKTIKHQRLASEYLSFSDFVTFIANEASRLNDPIFGALQESSTTRAGSHQKPASFATSTDQSATKDKKSTWSASRRSSCLVCGDSHILFFCKTFRSMSPDERMKVVTEHKLCINCLLSNHTVKDCNKSYVCTVNDCKQKHCKLLHSSIVKSVQGTNTIVNLDINVASSHIMMPIVPIIVNNSYATYALLDTGSSHSFCSKRLVSALGIQGNPTAYDLMTLNNAEKKNTLEVDISLQPEDRSDSFELQRVLVTESIPVRTEDVDLTKYNHLNNMSYPATDSVDVLIGQNYSDLLFIHEYRKGGPGEPYAARTSLGWCFHGPTVSAASHAMVTSTFISSKVIEQKLDRLYEFDQDGLIDSSTCDWSVEDNDVIELWHKSSKIEDQHISLPIPWKYANLKMPNNFYLAKHRLESLVKSIKKKDMMAQYSHEVQQLINNGYAELAPIDPETPTRCWYVPHHSVPKKSGQLRLVFDCSAQYKGTSINNSTSQGPKLTCDLFDILIRFRQFKHAVMGDIRHMYNQVRIPTSDRDALRFLWYIDGNLVHYRMTCFTFGGIFCASGSSYALQETAKLAPSQHVKDVILQNFYVDDMAYSSSDVQEAKDTISKVKEVLAQRSFCLTKFVATDQEMLTDVDPQDQLPIKDRQIQCQSDKALGLGWDVKADKLYIIHKLQHASTRSELLSSLASTFDPLGLMAPLTIHGKLIFQETTRMKLPWKSALPPDIQNEWNTWTDMLGHLNRIQVSRCLIPPEFTDGAFELHVFGDASNQAYGSVAFLRCLNRFGNIHVVMLCSKNRVNSLKSTATIPRLELQAAVLCTSLESSISKALSIQLLPTSFWTDSMIVLGFINNTQRRFHTYVSNRINKIRQRSDPSQWFFVPGDVNPADVLTRKKLPSQFDQKSWMNGPAFLATHKDTWSITRSITPTLPNIHPEIKPEAPTAIAVIATKEPIDELINHYSSWHRLKRSVAWLKRFLKVLQKKAQPSNHLEADEVACAEQCIIKHVQWSAFSADIKRLVSGTTLPRHSPLYNLDLYINDDGLLVVGGRLRHSGLQLSAKHPCILPYRHPVSTLVARSVHERCHLGREWVVSLIRKSYWIIKVRSLVYKTCKDCITCKKLFAPSGVQKMADLPEERLQYDKLPFDHVSVDCFGPYSVKYRRTTCKRYGCVFTCHNTRAIHIEKLDDLSCESFINGMRRFISRRGKPSLIKSDRGTNFTAAESELRKSMQKFDVDWQFLPAGASHMNGVVERQIRTIRKVFTGLLTEEQRLTDDILATLFCEVEGIVNSRPLTKVSDDPSDDAAMTPSDLLIVRSSQPVALGKFCQGDMLRRRWRYTQHLVEMFWRRYLREYIPQLQKRMKWTRERKSVKKGDLVLVVDENSPRKQWPMALIVETREGRDSLVCSVKLRSKGTCITRPVTKIVPLECD